MNLYLDTEFTGLHQNTKLISIGIVSADGHTFYAETCDFKTGFKNESDREWVLSNVVPSLLFYGGNGKGYNNVSTQIDGLKTEAFGETEAIRDALKEWLAQFGTTEIWSDCLAYDWVLFNELFGHAFNIPDNVYYIPFDICTMMKLKGIDPDIGREVFAFETQEEISQFGVDFQGMTEGKHNALWDAMVIKACYDKLLAIK